MSGLTARTKATYLKGKNGKLFLSDDKDLTTPYDELEGKISGIEYKQGEWQGKKTNKLELSVSTDDGDTYKLSIGVGSGAYFLLTNLLKNVDLSKNLAIVPIGEDGFEGKITTKFLIRQGGGFVKGYYKKDGPQLPKWEEKTINGETVWDKTEALAAVRADVEEMIASVKSATPVEEAAAPRSAESYVNNPALKTTPTVDEDDGVDSLPF